VGSLLITSLETYLRATFSDFKAGLIGIYLIIYGCLLIVVVRFVPQGCRLDRERMRAMGAMLELERHQALRRLTAIKDVSLRRAREILASSDPTARQDHLFNSSPLLRPNAGTVRLDGRDISGLAPHHVCASASPAPPAREAFGTSRCSTT